MSLNPEWVELGKRGGCAELGKDMAWRSVPKKDRVWQPIATAPKDGTRILGRLWEPDCFMGTYIEWETLWCKTSHVPMYGWNYGDDVEDLNLWEPTEWIPL